MRVAVGRAVRAGPGDEIVIKGRLGKGRLGRLFVFAKQGDYEFSPYVPNVANTIGVVDNRPVMRSPMSMRLHSAEPAREISFVSDIDGYLRVFQEVDTPDDPTAKITITRRICPDLPWTQRIVRRLDGMLTWIR